MVAPASRTAKLRPLVSPAWAMAFVPLLFLRPMYAATVQLDESSLPITSVVSLWLAAARVFSHDCSPSRGNCTALPSGVVAKTRPSTPISSLANRIWRVVPLPVAALNS